MNNKFITGTIMIGISALILGSLFFYKAEKNINTPLKEVTTGTVDVGVMAPSSGTNTGEILTNGTPLEKLNLTECDTMGNSGAIMECKNAVQERLKKINNGDITACDTLAKKEFCMKLFYFSEAFKKRDIQLCDKLSLKEDKENCIKTIIDGAIYKEKE